MHETSVLKRHSIATFHLPHHEKPTQCPPARRPAVALSTSANGFPRRQQRGKVVRGARPQDELFGYAQEALFTFAGHRSISAKFRLDPAKTLEGHWETGDKRFSNLLRYVPGSKVELVYNRAILGMFQSPWLVEVARLGCTTYFGDEVLKASEGNSLTALRLRSQARAKPTPQTVHLFDECFDHRATSRRRRKKPIPL
jgi:hypothetical protein